MAGQVVRVVGVLGAVTVIVMLFLWELSGWAPFSVKERAEPWWLPVLGIAMLLAGLVIIVKSGEGYRREATERDVGRHESAGNAVP
jgi:uncharacterized membrane protein